MEASGGRCFALPMTLRKRSARERGRAFGLAGLVLLTGALRALARWTSTSVPSGKARGLFSTTLPFFTLPRIVMRTSMLGGSILRRLAVFQQRQHRVQLLHRPLQLRDGVRRQLLRLGQVVGV